MGALLKRLLKIAFAGDDFFVCKTCIMLFFFTNKTNGYVAFIKHNYFFLSIHFCGIVDLNLNTSTKQKKSNRRFWTDEIKSEV